VKQSSFSGKGLWAKILDAEARMTKERLILIKNEFIILVLSTIYPKKLK
jgi:hypothetical protein